ncbi:8-amino-7-oxononanoate synthase [Desulfofundulus thermocisternus]|uniref:8-amino-7-oxononanoate synthase n=1 Tax=Desulfofundulus thermocisternus TaxID=42471 RepID=UPI0019FD88D3|nr:8-amino-7-oxononanoate synthase [Desulfofundulus thermocisternus]MBE3585156.1 8-amino-7-oxononanoate synthase [Thermoanaerobacter sp.]MCS5695999.1 8-amino-7-oxononanoate synthase [Desulfofundulus thermocisternus]MDK2888275.1 8-amino-7-oxononanoate synthase [Thermoanaerobacter sp.]
MIDFLSEELRLMKEHHLYRSLYLIDGPSEPKTIINGREMLLFSSNNYLGLASHPRVKAAAIAAVKRWGTGSGGSRLTTGNFNLHRQLEKRIARFKGTEDAIIFNTGYMANLGVISALAGREDLVISDQLNHASIVDGCRLSRATVRIYRHNDMLDLARILSDRTSFRRCLIVTDGVFSMDGDIAPLPQLFELAQEHQAMLMVDDAHATGVLGDRGAGTVEHFGLEKRGIIQMGTLSKALGSEGGYVAGTSNLIDFLRNRARSFIYSTALSPPVIASAMAALEVLENEPHLKEQLKANVRLFYQGLKDLGFEVLPTQSAIIPLMVGDSCKALALSAALAEMGVFVPAIRPPTVPEGTSRLRITLMATHTRDHIQFALDAFQKAGKKLGLL